MARDANSLIRKGLHLLEDVLEVVADVRDRVEDTDEHRGAHSRIASIEEHKATARLVGALAEIVDIGEDARSESFRMRRETPARADSGKPMPP